MAIVPVIFVASQVAAASRNIVFWDEFDSALDFILRLNPHDSWSDFLQRLFAVNNEHRTVTSRLIFAVSYWTSGTINFHVIGAIGNLFLVVACGLLVASVETWQRRLRFGVVLAFGLFQLEHFENFLWSGSSIDHFQVVMLAVAAIVALVRGTWLAWSVAALMAVLATFTLAHGTVVWPIGALLLWEQRRWRQLAEWAAIASAALGAFFWNFEFNPGHHIVALDVTSLLHVGRYWLELLGGAATLGEARFAPWFGVALLIGLGLTGILGAARRYPVAWHAAVFAVGGCALVAIGRVSLAGPTLNSRYLILSGVAWTILVFLLIEAGTQSERPFRLLAWMLPALAAFNVVANLHFAPLAEGFVEVRDRAATQFKQWGVDGHGMFRLYPNPGRAEAVLSEAAKRHVYQLPRFSKPAAFPRAEPSTRIISYADEVFVNRNAITVGGWAMIPNLESKRGRVYLVLRSENSTHIYSTITLQRPDVAKAYHEPRWRLSGFRAVVDRDQLPAEDFEVGVLIDEGHKAEFTMLPNKLRLSDLGVAQLANGQ